MNNSENCWEAWLYYIEHYKEIREISKETGVSATKLLDMFVRTGVYEYYVNKQKKELAQIIHDKITEVERNLEEFKESINL